MVKRVQSVQNDNGMCKLSSDRYGKANMFRRREGEVYVEPLLGSFKCAVERLDSQRFDIFEIACAS